MRLFTELWERLRVLLNRDSEDREMDEELRFHLEMETRKHVEAGLSPSDARRKARIRLGGVEGVKEEVRRARGMHAFESCAMDLRYGLRGLARSPGFTVVAIITIGLGIGANTAVFSVVHGVLLRSLAYPESDRLVRVYTTGFEQGVRYSSSIPDYLDWKALSTSFELMSGYRDGGAYLDRDTDRRVSLVRGQPELLQLLGIEPILGRLIQDADTRVDAVPVAVLTHELWMSRFGGDPDILGQSIRIQPVFPSGSEGIPYVVIGIAEPIPPGPVLSDLDVIVPWVLESDRNRENRDDRDLPVLARLDDGVSLDAAQAELDRIGAGLRDRYPENESAGPLAVSIYDETVSEVRPKLTALAGATGFILLIAVANIANLLLARGRARRPEFSVRVALGAGRWRLARLVWTESLLMAILGGILGVAIAYAVVQFLVSWAPAWIPRLEEIRIDAAVLGVSLAVTLACGLLCGLAPALSSRRSLMVRTGLVGIGEPDKGRNWTGSLLVVSQIVLSLVLLSASGLMIRSFMVLTNVPIGVDHSQVVTFSLHRGGGFTMGDHQGGETQRLLQRYQEVLDEVGTIPGVQGATLTSQSPLNSTRGGMPVTVLSGSTTGNTQRVDLVGVIPGFFEFVGSRLLAGRVFDSSDVSRADGVVVLDANLAGQLWPDEPALGQRLELFGTESEVLGVVAPIRYGDLADDMRPKLFHLLNRSSGVFGGTALVRHDGDPEPIVAAIESRVTDIDPSFDRINPRPLVDLFDSYLREPRFYLLLLGALGFLALAVAAVGVYGVVAYAVARRTAEIGIRMALGARRADIAYLFCRRTLVFLGAGLAVGLMTSSLLTIYIESLLFQTEPTDPVVMVSVAALLAATGLVATLIPIRRALRVDPADTLRLE